MISQKSIKDKIIKNQKNKCLRCLKKLDSKVWFYKCGAGGYYKLISGDISGNTKTIVGLCSKCHSEIEDREKIRKQFEISGDGVRLIFKS